jgi:hypothetical protein
LIAALAATPNAVLADGCYICEGGGYVQYYGEETFEMRKRAKAIGCKVTGTSSSCSNPKGTVVDPKEMDKRRNK